MCKRDFFHHRREHGHRHHGRCGSNREPDEISHHRFRGFYKKHHHHEKFHNHHGPHHHKEHMCRFEQPRHLHFERKRDFNHHHKEHMCRFDQPGRFRHCDFPRRRHEFRNNFKRLFHGSHRPHHQHEHHPIRSQSC